MAYAAGQSARRLGAEWAVNHPRHFEIYGRSLPGNPTMQYFDGVWTQWRRELFAKLPPLLLSDAPRDMYQFGVYTGGGLREMLLLCEQHQLPVRHVYGFDSFAGLPPETSGVARDRRWGLLWKEGAFDASAALGTLGDTRATMQAVRAYVLANQTAGPSRPGVTLVPGFFNESLTRELPRGMRPAMYIDVDVDLYRSSMDALRWVFANGIAVVGTVIGYDDWSIKDGGEQKAHAQIEREFNVTFARVGLRAGGVAAFQVLRRNELPTLPAEAALPTDEDHAAGVAAAAHGSDPEACTAALVRHIELAPKQSALACTGKLECKRSYPLALVNCSAFAEVGASLRTLHEATGPHEQAWRDCQAARSPSLTSGGWCLSAPRKMTVACGSKRETSCFMNVSATATGRSRAYWLPGTVSPARSSDPATRRCAFLTLTCHICAVPTPRAPQTTTTRPTSESSSCSSPCCPHRAACTTRWPTSVRAWGRCARPCRAETRSSAVPPTMAPATLRTPPRALCSGLTSPGPWRSRVPTGSSRLRWASTCPTSLSRCSYATCTR